MNRCIRYVISVLIITQCIFMATFQHNHISMVVLTCYKGDCQSQAETTILASHSPETP